MTDVQGFVAPGFEAVRDAFARNFSDHADVGAQFALYRGGELIVDLAGGTTTVGGSQPYTHDHLQLVYSTTKGATAVCAHVLAERGELDFDAPVTDYWPEFKAHGKADVPVSWLLCHKVGLPDVDRPMTYEQALAWDPVVEALADSVPLWEPGTQHGYHAVTYGWLVGELVRRVSGKSLGTFFRDEVAGPLGLDFWIGLPDEQHTRVVPLVPLTLPAGIDLGLPPEQMPGMMDMMKMVMGPDSLIARALTAPGGAFSSMDIWEDPALWRAELGAANGITNARSLAKMYAATVGEIDGVRLFSPQTLAAAIEPQATGVDAVLMFDIPFGLGFMRDSAFSKFGSPSAFGHYGLGGSVGFADAEAGIAFGYVMNKLELSLAGDPRTSDLIDAVYASL
jgi:CubicO group peptidase (beta-lactamase class C family)